MNSCGDLSDTTLVLLAAKLREFQKNHKDWVQFSAKTGRIF